MLIFIFVTEACYTVKENNNNNNNKEKSFRQGKLPFCWRKLRKAYCIDIFFVMQKI